uniref:Ring canal kelch homolog n=1 Tax=Cacopsylla melanoneura TaxID=428564 RepID=A0A8D8WR71_9HEMI
MESAAEGIEGRSCLLLRYASQNSLDESSQKQVQNNGSREKPPYRNALHTNKAFETMNIMRKCYFLLPTSFSSLTSGMPVVTSSSVNCTPPTVSVYVPLLTCTLVWTFWLQRRIILSFTLPR